MVVVLKYFVNSIWKRELLCFPEFEINWNLFALTSLIQNRSFACDLSVLIMNVIVSQHKTKHFFQCECFLLFLSKKSLSFRWLNQKREENEEKKKKSSKSKGVIKKTWKTSL